MANTLTTRALYHASLDPSGFKAGAEELKRSAAGVTQAVDKISESTTKAGRNAATSRTGFDQLMVSLDKNVAAATQYQRTMDNLNRYQKAGVISSGEYSTALGLVRNKFADLHGAQEAATRSGSGFTQMLGTARGVLGAFGIALSVGTLLQFGRSVMDTADRIADMSAGLRVSSGFLSAWEAAAARSGVAADRADQALARLNDKFGDAVRGGEEARKLFQMLGVDVDALAAKEADLTEIAAAFNEGLRRQSSAFVAASAAQDGYGRGVAKLMPVLLEGEQGINKMLDAVNEFGIASDRNITAIDKWGDAVGDNMRSVKNAAMDALGWLIRVTSYQAENSPMAQIERQRQAMRGGTTLGPGATPAVGIAGRSPAVAGGARPTDVNWTGGVFDPMNLAASEKAAAAAQAASDAWQKSIDEFIKFSAAETARAGKEIGDTIEAGWTARLAGEKKIAADFAALDKTRSDNLKQLSKEQLDVERESAERVRRYWEDVWQDLRFAGSDFFDSLFIDGELSFGRLGDSLKRIFGRVLSDMATQAIAQPIIMPIFQAIQGAAGALGGATGAIFPGLPGAAAGSAMGGMGGLGGLGQLGGMLGLGGLGTMGGLFGSTGAGISASFMGATGSMGAASTAGILGGSAGLAGVLGAAGLGALGGGMFADLIGGNKTGGSIGGGIGSALGMMTPLGPLGALLGGLAGSAIGGLFGNSKPSNYTAFANFGADWSTGGGLAGDKPNSATLAAAAQAGKAISEAAKILEAAGIELTDNVMRLRIGQRDTSKLQLTSGGFVDVGPAGDIEAAVKGTLDYLLKGASSSNATVQQVLSSYAGRGGVTTENIDQLASDIDFAASIENLSFVEEKLTASEQILKAISEQFETAIGRAQELGIETAKVEEARDRAIAELRTGFNEASQDAIDQLINPTFAAWTALAAAQADRMKEAAALGADTALLERRGQLERQEFLRELNDEQRTALVGLIDLSFDLAARIADLQRTALSAIDVQISAASQFGNEMRSLARSYEQSSASLGEARGAFLVGDLSPLSPMDQYRESRSQLQAMQARALGGNVDAMRDLGGLSQTFLRHSLNVNASTSAYGQDFDFVQGILGSAKSVSDAMGAGATGQANLADSQVSLLLEIKTTLQAQSPDAVILIQQLAALDAIAAQSGALAAAIGMPVTILDAPTLRNALYDVLLAIDSTAVRPAIAATPEFVPTPLPGMAPGDVTQPGGLDGMLPGAPGPTDYVESYYPPAPDAATHDPYSTVPGYGSYEWFLAQMNGTGTPADMAPLVDAVEQQTAAVEQLVRSIAHGMFGGLLGRARGGA